MFASSRQCSQRRRMGRGAQARRGAISWQRLTHLFSGGRGLRESGRVPRSRGIKYAIRLPTNRVLQERIAYLLTRPVGRPPNEMRRYHANFTYQAGSWTKPRRVTAKVEWHPGELHSHQHKPPGRARRCFLQQARNMRAMDQGRQIKWTRLSCRTFAAHAVRLQLHALAYNL